ncbi:hypothetical protein KFL_006010080 [Klebsormidium nitens]|uniref:Nudix hydrolase domain-containing protein n=1 Tax=Klebsormidium nitens TaxID=105231 RepID=A0A1Y1ILT9_KLENI|nr:hypothetical protein KFL_006010080 [Klebsormidium nitens]|eukprot:GAQ90111.1 hypothetical protein KFL_006010080 [Klebsormidium nitens]
MQPVVVNGTTAVVTGRISPSGSESPLVARTGRHKQRYENGVRLLAGCIPYRTVSKVGADGRSQDITEVLLITSQHGKALLFPKGGWEIDETMEEAALREAMEEAGVRGVLGEALGAYDFKSKRKEQEDGNWTQLDCRAYVYPLRVTEEMETWPEQDSRSRSWCPLDEAITKLRHDWMQQALSQWGATLGPSVFSA